MSGMEIYGTLAATAGLVKVAIEVKKYCNRTAEEFRALEQAKISGLHQIMSLRIYFRSLATSFDKINTDVDDSLSQKDKDAVGEIVKNLYEVMEGCEGTVSKIRNLTKKKLHTKSELDVLREELRDASSTVNHLQTNLNTLISLEALRRVSRDHAVQGTYNSNELLHRRDSDSENFSPATRQGTIDSTSSTPTLTSALSPQSTYSTGSSSRSTSHSTYSTCSTTLVESKQLRSAVDEKDQERIAQLIGLAITEGKQESWTATAFFLACSSRRVSLVRFLLPRNPNVHVIDDSGLGVMHAAIGLSEQLSKVKERDTTEILKLLVDHDPLLLRSLDKQRRQPLHYCAMTGNLRAAEYILGVDRSRINATDSSKKTPLYHICEHHSPNKKLVKLLLKNGGHFETRNRPRMQDVRLAEVRKLLDEAESTRKLTCLPKSERNMAGQGA